MREEKKEVDDRKRKSSEALQRKGSTVYRHIYITNSYKKALLARSESDATEKKEEEVKEEPKEPKLERKLSRKSSSFVVSEPPKTTST